MKPLDLLDKELNIDDYVVFHNCIYSVVGIGKADPRTGNGRVRIMLLHKAKTTRSVVKNSRDMCKVLTDDVMAILEKETE